MLTTRLKGPRNCSLKRSPRTGGPPDFNPAGGSRLTCRPGTVVTVATFVSNGEQNHEDRSACAGDISHVKLRCTGANTNPSDAGRHTAHDTWHAKHFCSPGQSRDAKHPCPSSESPRPHGPQQSAGLDPPRREQLARQPTSAMTCCKNDASQGVRGSPLGLVPTHRFSMQS